MNNNNQFTWDSIKSYFGNQRGKNASFPTDSDLQDKLINTNYNINKNLNVVGMLNNSISGNDSLLILEEIENEQKNKKIKNSLYDNDSLCEIFHDFRTIKF